jgi:hypothetical protein
MSDHVIMARLSRFAGRTLISSADEIIEIAHQFGYTVNVVDPLFNTGQIDNEPKRLNVRTDKDSNIVSFSIG